MSGNGWTKARAQVEKMREKGYTGEQIRKMALERGWTEEQVEKLLSAAVLPPPPQAPAPPPPPPARRSAAPTERPGAAAQGTKPEGCGEVVLAVVPVWKLGKYNLGTFDPVGLEPTPALQR